MTKNEQFLKDAIDTYLDRLKVVLYEKALPQVATWSEEDFNLQLAVQIELYTDDCYLYMKAIFEDDEPIIFGGEFE